MLVGNVWITNYLYSKYETFGENIRQCPVDVYKSQAEI